MKAITAVCATGASVSSVSNGRISRHRGDGENAEIQMYLSKLKDLVPNMPKNKKLSKLEVIQNVIDYICDLQSALETTNQSSALNAFDASAILNGQYSNHHQLQQQQQQLQQHNSLNQRQPLVIRSSPNTILMNNNNNNHSLNVINESSTTLINTVRNNFIISQLNTKY